MKWILAIKYAEKGLTLHLQVRQIRIYENKKQAKSQ